MTEIEQDHIVDAYTFELGKVEVPAVVERMVARLDAGRRRARPAGLRRPRARRPTLVRQPVPPPEIVGTSPRTQARSPDATGGLDASPALAMVTEDAYPVDGRVVQILANDGCDLAGIRVRAAALSSLPERSPMWSPHTRERSPARRGATS